MSYSSDSDSQLTFANLLSVFYDFYEKKKRREKEKEEKMKKIKT